MRLIFSTASANNEVVAYEGLTDINTILFLLENASLHFTPELLGNQIGMLVTMIGIDQTGTVNLHCRQVRTLFDALSIGMCEPLQTMRYNLNSARVPDEEAEAHHNKIYEDYMRSMLVQSRLLPLVIQAAYHCGTISVRVEE